MKFLEKMMRALQDAQAASLRDTNDSYRRVKMNQQVFNQLKSECVKGGAAGGNNFAGLPIEIDDTVETWEFVK